MQKVVCEGVGLRGVNLVFGIAVCVHGAVWAGLQRKYKKLEFFWHSRNILLWNLFDFKSAISTRGDYFMFQLS